MNSFEAGRLRPGHGVFLDFGDGTNEYGEVESLLGDYVKIFWEDGTKTEIHVEDFEGIEKHDAPPRPRVVDTAEKQYTPARASSRPAASSHFH